LPAVVAVVCSFRLPKEMGIFYVGFPNDEYLKITGILEKEFFTVPGDGVSTIEQLLN